MDSYVGLQPWDYVAIEMLEEFAIPYLVSWSIYSLLTDSKGNRMRPLSQVHYFHRPQSKDMGQMLVEIEAS